jgi:spermidine/putrescine transport system ATP-binding protein
MWSREATVPEGALLSFRGVRKEFDGVVAVQGVDLDVREGEFITLLGPSGCGKTTLLRMVAGFERPSAGSILLEGRDVAGRPPELRPFNMVFQSYALFPHMSVFDNVAYGLRTAKLAEDEIRRRVSSSLELVGLEDRVGVNVRMLSGGQQQRVALVRALVNEPRVLLLDEPLGALDLKLRKGLQIELKGIQREVGITFVYVTHDQEEALTMSDRIAVMNRGLVEQVGVPEDVYERPETTFVAGFIGVSNLMPGKVESVSGELTKVRLESGVDVEARADGLRTGERCHAVVRPEKLRISRAEEPQPDGQPSVEGVVDASVYLGTTTQIVVRLRGDVPMTVLVPNADESERQRLPGGGASVRLSWAPEHIHLVRESAAPPPEEGEAATVVRGPETQATVTSQGET